jgi:MFS transporter, UMF1 family
MTEIAAGASGTAPPRMKSSGAAVFSWCLFDWANSAFPTVITTFVFGAYFTQGVAADPTLGTALWGQALGVAGLVVALTSPFLGALADRGGARKPWLGLFAAVCVAATAALWFVRPVPNDVWLALVLVGAASVAFELTMVFYNAMLPDLVPDDRIGRVSGWGWGLGYAGGLGCLLLCLYGFVQADPPPFGLDKRAAEHVRAVAPVVAVWFALFALPLFAVAPDRRGAAAPVATILRDGGVSLFRTLRDVRKHANVARFLLASLLYLNGLTTLFAFGGIYAAGAFGMDMAEVIRFGIALNVTAGLGAAGFAWLDDWIGPRRTILLALGGLILAGAAILLVRSAAGFWVFALILGIFIGPAQAAGRSLMARLAPAGMEAEMFGLYALSGKATNFLGPAALGWATLVADSQRVGMSTILAFLAAGLLLLLTVKEPAR